MIDAQTTRDDADMKDANDDVVSEIGGVVLKRPGLARLAVLILVAAFTSD